MKNGIFNIIRGIAFCFVLSIICLFGRVETKANTSELTSNDVKKLAEKGFGHSLPENLSQYQRYADYWNSSPYACIFIVENTSNNEKILCIEKWTDSIQSKKDYYKEYCDNNNYRFLFSWLALDSDGIMKYFKRDDYLSKYSSSFFCCLYSQNGNYSTNNSWSSNYYNANSSVNKITILLNSGEPQDKSYDSTLGYLTNVKVKRASPFLLTDMSTEFTNIIDRFSWGAVTSGGSSFDGVDIRIKTFKNEDILAETETHINCPPDNYNFDWVNYIDLTLKDWVFGNLFRYEIYFRPTFGNKYGDYCYFNVGFPTSVNEQIEATLDPKYLTDTIQYVENVGYIDNFDEYSPPSDGTTLFVPNYVVPNKPIDDINNDLVDDNVVPPSSPSYTEIINNITIIQNGNQSGDSLLDLIGDLFTFFKEFLQFLYNFINLLLTPLAFLPSWLKSLISMSIVMCLAICIIKIIRG